MGDQNIGKYMFGNFGIPLVGKFWASGNQFWLPKLVRGTSFFCQNQSGGPIFGGTDFGVTGYLACDPAMVKCM